MAQTHATQDRVNDFVIKLANVNGTGSASANTMLMKSIFRMGVPVMGKNYFPSNIQGLPTWYEIRVTRDGYVARSGRVDLMVAMNAETYAKDVREVGPSADYPLGKQSHGPDFLLSTHHLWLRPRRPAAASSRRPLPCRSPSRRPWAQVSNSASGVTARPL